MKSERYKYHLTKEYVRIVNSSGTFDEKYVYQDGVLVAQIDTDGNKQFIHNDHEGSNTLITDINSNVLENTFYSPYGEIISGGTASRFDYEGKEFDSQTNRLDFGFRQIDPKVPIWDKPDTLIQNVYDPQSLNRYSFERSNPYAKIDPDGHWAEAINFARVTPAGAIIITLIVIYIELIHPIVKQKTNPRQKELEKQPEQQQQNGQKEIPKGNVENDANAANKEQTQPKNEMRIDPKSIKVEIEIDKLDIQIPEEDLKKIKPPEGTTKQLEPPKISTNEKDNVDGSSSSINAGKMSYAERLAKHLRLVRESNRKERRCKKTC